jgi:hypothetical protein
LRKYQESDDTHATSISDVLIPRCNILLKRNVKGNGSLTIECMLSSHDILLYYIIFYLLSTNPEKK